MQWIRVNEDYLDYLRTYEKRVPLTNYGDDKYKPFFGVLFEKEDLCYVTQISHPQPRHKDMKNQLDFYKIYDSNNKLLAVVNLNYMFPIPKTQISKLKKRDIGQYRYFKSDKEKSKYIDLLDKEMQYINTLNLSMKAKKIYSLKYKFPYDKVSVRCFNFKELEQKAQNFNEVIDFCKKM